MYANRRTIFFAIALVLAAMPVSWARRADGTLGLIRYPISTNPALAVPGGSFTLQLTSEKPVSNLRVELYTKTRRIVVLRSAPGQAFGVEDRRSFSPSGEWWASRSMVTLHDLVRVPIKLPVSAREGLYGLRVTCSAGTDTSERAVRVFKKWPTKYDFCHVTDAHIGKRDMPNTDGILLKVAERVNGQKPAFVLVTGDNTDDSTPEQHRLFVSILDHFEVPTFVLPGNHDSYGGPGTGTADVATFLGDGNYSFNFGEDHYLGIEGVAGKFGPEQEKFAEDDLAAEPSGSFKCVFNHDEYDKMRPWLTSLLEKHHVSLYLYGHHHRDLVDLQPAPKMTSVLTDAAFSRKGYYNIITIEDHKVKSVTASSGMTD